MLIFSGRFSQNIYVFCSAKLVAKSAALISKANNNLASVSRMIAHASFCPIHLCRPTRNGSYTSRRSEGNGVWGKKRSGTNDSGFEKLAEDRNAGYWFTATKVLREG